MIIESNSTENSRNLMTVIIFKTDFPGLAYNSNLGWEYLNDNIYGLSLRGIFIGLVITFKRWLNSNNNTK